MRGFISAMDNDLNEVFEGTSTSDDFDPFIEFHEMHPEGEHAADATDTAEEQQLEAPYVSIFDGVLSQWMAHLPLWQLVEGREQKTLGMGNAATPEVILAVLHRTIKERALSQSIVGNVEVKSTEFSNDAWIALFRECGKGSDIPLMGNQADRFVVLAYLRHHFCVNDGKVEEAVYNEDGTSTFTQQHNKSQLKNISDAKVSSALCFLSLLGSF